MFDVGIYLGLEVSFTHKIDRSGCETNQHHRSFTGLTTLALVFPNPKTKTKTKTKKAEEKSQQRTGSRCCRELPTS
jgi:hypothetical protein